VKERLDRSKLVVWLAVAGAIAALNFSARFTTSNESQKDAIFLWSLAVNGAVFYAIIIAVSLTLARERPDLRPFRMPSSWPGAIGLGLLAFLTVYVVSWVVVALGANPAREQGLLSVHWQGSRIAPFVANAIVVVILAPFTEELFVRGVGFGLLRPVGAAAAIVLSALVWALMHGLVYGFFPLFAFGIALGYLRERSQSVVPGMLVHSLYNGIALAAAFA
jgi:membrane protease YdiL (CAAX protease family)